MTIPPRISKSKQHSLRKLTQKKYRKEEQEFLLEGRLLLQEALKSQWSVQTVLVSEQFLEEEDSEALLSIAEEWGIETFLLNDRELSELTDVVTPQGVVAVASWKISYLEDVLSAQPTDSLIVAVDRISDPGNLGTIIRTSDWFQADALLISENSVDLYSPKVVRATMGSIFHLPILHEESLETMVRQCKQAGYSILACSAEADINIHQYSFEGKNLILLGSESHGIRPEILPLADIVAGIPRYGQAESLNVGIACGIILAEARNKRSALQN